jgi:hypothetical protein
MSLNPQGNQGYRAPQGDPLYGRGSQPTGNYQNPNNLNTTGRPSNGLHDSQVNKIPNKLNDTYIDEHEQVWRGDGANVISDRLNFGGGQTVIQGAPQVQYVTREVVREVVEEERVTSAPVYSYDDSINVNGRNILAESMAKVALLIMENNRLKWVESQRVAELTRLRSIPVVIERPVEVKTIVQAPPCCPTCLRPYPHGWTGPMSTTGHVTSYPVTTTGTNYVSGTPVYQGGQVTRLSGTTPVVQPGTVRTSGGYTTTQPATFSTSGPTQVYSPQTTTVGTNGVRPLNIGGTQYNTSSPTSPTLQRGPVTGTTTFGATSNTNSPTNPNNGAPQSPGLPKTSPPSNQTAVFASQLAGPQQPPAPGVKA